MANIPNTLQLNGWGLSVPWAEYIGPHGSTSSFRLSYGTGNQATMTIQCYWSDIAVIIPQIIGSSFYNTSTGNLDRFPPIQHPILPQLYASSVEVHPLKFTGQLDGDPQQSNYLLATITIGFTQPKYTILTDAQIDSEYGSPRAEWQRYLNLQSSPQSSVLQRPGGTTPPAFQYAEGGAGITGTPVLSSVNQYLQESELTLTWMQVPALGLRTSGGTGPCTNLDKALNTCNVNDFMGYTALTLRFKTYQLQEIESPVYDASQYPIGAQPIYYNVVLSFGVAVRPFDSGSGLLQPGWLGFPKPGSAFWYKVTANGSPSGAGIIPTSDFTRIFVMTS